MRGKSNQLIEHFLDQFSHYLLMIASRNVFCLNLRKRQLQKNGIGWKVWLSCHNYYRIQLINTILEWNPTKICFWSISADCLSKENRNNQNGCQWMETRTNAVYSFVVHIILPVFCHPLPLPIFFSLLCVNASKENTFYNRSLHFFFTSLLWKSTIIKRQILSACMFASVRM